MKLLVQNQIWVQTTEKWNYIMQIHKGEIG